MKVEEAIKGLKVIAKDFSGYKPNEEMFEMAISALQAQDVPDTNVGDMISRKAAIDEWGDDFKGYVNALNIPRDDYNGIMAYIDELLSAQPEPCEDAVSRKAAVEEIRRHGVGSFDFEDYTPEQAERFVIKLLQNLPSVTPKPQIGELTIKECENAVSRVDVLECFADLYDTLEYCSKGIINELHRKFEDLRTLPSVIPKRKTGKWIEHSFSEDGKTRLIECSECGAAYIVNCLCDYSIFAEERRYCNKCGAKMEVAYESMES